MMITAAVVVTFTNDVTVPVAMVTETAFVTMVTMVAIAAMVVMVIPMVIITH